jgi:hypothetical protein
MTEDLSSPEQLAASYLARFDWRRGRMPGPPPRTRTLSIWEKWIQEDPERAWPLFEALVRLRPNDDEVLEQVWYRLRQLLARHGRRHAQRVADFVGTNERLRRIAPAHELDPAAHRPKPLDIPRLVDAYVTMATHADDAHELARIINSDPETGVALALEIVSRGPLFGFTSYDTFSPLHDVLRRHGHTVMDAVETAATDSVLVRRCLWRAGRGQRHPPSDTDIPPDIWARVERAIAGTTDYNTDDPPGAANSLPPDHERVVTAWFVHEETFWAWELVTKLVESDPEPAWRVISLLVEAAPSHDVLEIIGAGPLEDFLSAHGQHFIERIEKRAGDDPRFRHCLATVWQGDIPDTLWARIQTAVGETDTD